MADHMISILALVCFRPVWNLPSSVMRVGSYVACGFKGARETIGRPPGAGTVSERRSRRLTTSLTCLAMVPLSTSNILPSARNCLVSRHQNRIDRLSMNWTVSTIVDLLLAKRISPNKSRKTCQGTLFRILGLGRPSPRWQFEHAIRACQTCIRHQEECNGV
jgi:hypothetical protein